VSHFSVRRRLAAGRRERALSSVSGTTKLETTLNETTHKTAGELATAIIEAARDPDRIAALVSEDVTWWITPSIPAEIMESVTHGRDTMRGNRQRVFSTLYQSGSVHTVVHQVISQGTKAWEYTGIAHSTAQMQAAANQG
jgi:SnoaL-like domain